MKNVGLIGALYLTGNYTFTVADHLKFVMVDTASAVTLTVPSTLPDGFSFFLQQQGTGTITINPGGRIQYSNAARVSTTFQQDSALFSVVNSNTILNALFGLPLPTLQASSTSSQALSSTTMTNCPGISFSLLGQAVYDADFRVAFSTNNAASALRIGLSALPSGSTCQLEGRVWNTNVAGTAPYTNTLLLSASSIIAAGTASVSGAQQLAVIKGRIYTGGGGGSVVGTLTGQTSSISTTGVVTVATGAANMVLTQVF